LWLLLSSSVLSYPQLKITVYTDKPSYTHGERIEIYGQVTLGDVAVENAMVALEVRDPSSSPIITRTAETNSSGIYVVSFTLDAESPPGIYTVHVSCSHAGEKASNTTSFHFENLPSLVLTVETSSETYKPDQIITIFGTATYDDSPLQGKLVAIEVQDPDGTPLVVVSKETNELGNYQLTLRLPSESKMGEYRVYAGVSYKDEKIMVYTTFRLQVVLSTDINGDGIVNILDLALVAKAWNTRPGDPKWNPRCDLDGNGLINILDIVPVARDFGKKL
jgi:uncharacterized protein YfaS (alpha-2-macroglobulin family)